MRQYNGVSLVDIREFYLDKDTGEKKPGKKGISLTEDSYWKLVEAQAEIQSALVQLKEGGTKAQKTEPTTKIAVEKTEGAAGNESSDSKSSASSTKKTVKSAEIVEDDGSDSEAE